MFFLKFDFLILIKLS